MSGPDQEKLGVKLHVRPSLDTISAIPIKKRRLFFSRSPSPPPETQSSLTVECGTTHNGSFSLVQVSSLEASDIPTLLTASSDEGSSLESGFKILVNGGISEAPKHEDPIEHDCNEKLQSMASIVVEGKNESKDTVSDDKLVSLKRIEQLSAPVDHVDVPMEEEILDAKNFSCQTPSAGQLSGNTELQCKETFVKVHISESHSVRQAQLELQDPTSRKDKCVYDPQMKCFKSGPNTDSTQSCLDRSNWDLNTTMDTWEETMNDYLTLNHEGDGQDRSGFGGFPGRGRQPNLMDTSATKKKPNVSPPMIGEPKSLSSDHFLSLCTSPNSGGVCCNSETETCLDLRLKPSFMSESYFTYGPPFTLKNVDSLKETQFLGLSTMPSSSSVNPKFSLCGAVKPEPYYGCIQIEKKTEITGSEAFGSEAFGLKSIKSEPREIGEASRITISGVVNSASDAAIKLEPVEDKSEDCVAAKETRMSHISTDDHNLLQNAKTPLEAFGTGITASNTKSDLFIKDVTMQIPGKSHLHKYEVDSKAQVMQNEILSNDKICHRTMSAATSISQSEKGICCEPKSLVIEPLVDEGRELISIKQASIEGSEQADVLIKCQIEGQIMNLVSEACKQPHIAAESVCESFNSGTLVERIVDEKTEIDSNTNLSETDLKTVTVVETYANCDVLQFNQAMNQSICMMEEQGDNECKTGSPHVMDGGMRAVHEKGGIDDHGYEDGEVKDGTLLGANGGSHLRVEIKKAEGACPRGIVDVPVTMSSSHELVKHSIIESSEMSKDLGTVECANNIDPAIAADLQESSSVTGDSNRMKTSKTTRKTPRDSFKKDKVLERKTKFDRDPTLRVVSIENKADGSGIMENAGGRAKSSVPLSASEAIKDFDRGCTGRIINLNSASSRKMKPIHERPLSSRVNRENPTDKLFNREKSHFRYSRDENPIEKFNKTENENRRGFAFGNHGSGLIHTRVSGGSGSSHLRFRNKLRPNQFGDRNCNPNYMREQINDHNDFRYSRAINSAEVSRASGPDVSIPCAGRISRKVTNELQSRTHMACRRNSPGNPEQMPVMRHPTNEVNPSRCMQRDAPDLVYVSQEKMNRTLPGEMLDPLRAHPHSQFERTDRIPAHHERPSLSPVHRRGPPQLTSPLCSPRSQAMSPSHWSPHGTSEGFNGQPEMMQCRTGTPISMQESMRPTRQHFTEEILARRRGTAYGARLPDGMMEVISSREHDFPRSGRDFPRKIQRLDMNDARQVPGECYRTPFGHGQIHELAVDGECAVGRRCNEVHVPARYRPNFIAGDDDVENFSFHGHEGGPPRSYRYHAEGNQGFNEGGNSREFEGRFRNRLGNTSRRYRHIEQQQQQQEDEFRHQEGQGWNDSGFNNIRPKRRRY